MSDDNDDGRLPFDPARVSPVELVVSKKRALGRFIDENSRVVLICSTALVIAAWYIGIGLPPIPTWVGVAAFTVLVTAPPTVVVARRTSKWLFSPDYVLISEQNPSSGDQRLIRLSPDRFEDMTILNHNDAKREQSFLKKVTINGQRAYEVDDYDREENRAIASWQAGVTNAEIRRDRKAIKRIKTSLEREADKALELLANHPSILREQAKQVSNRIIKVAEGVEVPEGGDLHQNLTDRMDEMDPSEDLLDGMTDGEPEDDDEVNLDDRSDIFERVASDALAQTGMTNGNSKNGDNDE